MRPEQGIPTVSECFDDGSIVELLYNPQERKTLLALYQSTQWTLLPHIDLATGRRLVPFSPENNLIKNNVVLLPSEPAAYDTEERLVSDIRQFIHRYVDLSSTFEHLATYYVILSWLYDAFAELPYLRLRGDFGTGKTRALLVIGSICYKPFFASGASTVSPLFHTLDAFRGTMIFDEADFRFSDERAEITKILNNGNVRGLPVLRTMMNRQREFNPRAFQVFGPKIVATRGIYEDKALESRFLTEDMGGRPLRSDVPINLPDEMHEEARELRNKLLLFRFNRRFDTVIDPSLADAKLHPRANQILLPLLSIVKDPALRDELRLIALNTQEGIVAERGLHTEAQVLEILAGKMLAAGEHATISLADITAAFIDRFGAEYGHPITNRWIGGILRRRLHIKTHKSHGIYVVPGMEKERIRQLCDRYGVQRTRSDVQSHVQLGDVGTWGTS
ncbi:hypothetical protein [Bradyrhizobium acaciae]|uniref:hypothetical protein n=1 Tax=Bradyrhizobium acaciae TaxID=2683706 RepID=UPI001E3D2587|nr:hypothetical protein [Bradyrhizobium acaciae]MCC8977600.1 hypothetical protein [Bradyrhizobium acaciae]